MCFVYGIVDFTFVIGDLRGPPRYPTDTVECLVGGLPSVDYDRPGKIPI